MQNFRQLQVWQKGHRLVLAVYKATARFPDDELYGLRSQMRRCAVSGPANIAEGCGHGSNPDLLHFLYIATGSASDRDHLTGEVAEVKRMPAGLMHKLKGDNPPANGLPETDH